MAERKCVSDEALVFQGVKKLKPQPLWLSTRGGTRLHSQLPNECDYLPRVLEFMAIIFVIIEISNALWTQKI